MNILKKIKKLCSYLNKTKCPNCKSTKLEILEKKILDTVSKPYYSYSKYEAPSERAMKELHSSPDYYYEYKVYDVKYQCKECKTIFQKEKKY